MKYVKKHPNNLKDDTKGIKKKEKTDGTNRKDVKMVDINLTICILKNKWRKLQLKGRNCQGK